jgi:hypothetical protein
VSVDVIGAIRCRQFVAQVEVEPEAAEALARRSRRSHQFDTLIWVAAPHVAQAVDPNRALVPTLETGRLAGDLLNPTLPRGR